MAIPGLASEAELRGAPSGSRWLSHFAPGEMVRTAASRNRAYRDRIHRVSCVGLPASCPNFLRSYEQGASGASLRLFHAVERLHDALGEINQFVEATFNDFHHQIEVDFRIFVHKHVAKSHHRFEFFRHCFVDDSRFREKREAFRTVFGQTEFLFAYGQIGEIDAQLTKPLQV
jgi:hypothetical protein